MWFSTLHHGQKSWFKSKNLQEPVNYSNDNTVTWGSMTVKLLNNVEPIFQWLNFSNSDVDRYHSSIIHLNMFISYTVLSYNSWFWAICTTLYQKSNFIFGKFFCVGFEKKRVGGTRGKMDYKQSIDNLDVYQIWWYLERLLSW